MGGWLLCLDVRNFRSLIVVLKEKCLSELKIEPQQLSIEEITRETIDKLFEFMPSEEKRISELRDSLDKDVYVGFYRQNEATYYSRNTITDDLTEYIERGKSIRTDKHPHLQNIIKAFLEVQNHDFGLIGEKVSNPQALPFFLICCSSGTGKTQLPFSLPQAFPIFYFLFNRKLSPGTQLIYNCFSSVSIALQKCIEEDLKKLKENLFGQEHEKAGATEETLSTFLHLDTFLTEPSFFTLGFIVKIMEKYFSSDRSKSSLKFLTELETFKFESMSYPEAKEKIRELRKNVPYTPIIFIDETTLDRKMKPNDKTLESFLFLRTVLRLIHVIPVFMGTNFNPTNFLLSGHTSDSRSKDKCYRTYVIYKLPPVPANIWKKETYGSLKFLVKDINDEEIVYKVENIEKVKKVTSIEDFVIMIYKFLKNERPLFFHDFVKALNDYFEGNTSSIKFNVLFKSLVGIIFSKFRARKRKADCNWEFNYSQFCFLASKNRETLKEREEHKIDSENQDIPFVSDLRYIHRHTGFLIGPADGAEFTDKYDVKVAKLFNEDVSVTVQLISEADRNTTPSIVGNSKDRDQVATKENASRKGIEVTTEEKEVGSSYPNTDARATFFKLFSDTEIIHEEKEEKEKKENKEKKFNNNQYYDEKGEICDYRPYTIFPNNQKYCLSGLALAALKEDRMLIFTDEYDKSKRISTVNVLCDVSANLDPGVSYEKEKYRFEPAEALVHTAIVIASHANGFETATIKQVLEAFVQELDYYAEYDSVLPPSIDFSELKNLKERTNDKFPYLAPVDQQWNTEFVEFMQIIFPRFQYGTANYPRVGNDMYINRDNSREYSSSTFMCIEVKCHKKPIGEDGIRTLANTLLGNHGEFFLFVVRKKAENESEEDAEEIDSEENIKKINTTPKGNIFLLQKREQEKSGFYFKCIQTVKEPSKILFAMDLGVINGNKNIDAISKLFAKW